MCVFRVCYESHETLPTVINTVACIQTTREFRTAQQQQRKKKWIENCQGMSHSHATQRNL